MQKSLKIIKYLLWAGIFFIPFTPLIVTSSLFFPFITGKNFFFRILVEILLGLWFVLALYDKRYRPRKSWILIFFGAFVFIMSLATIFGANPYHSFWSNYERMEGLLTYFHLLAYFLILTAVLNTERLWKWFFHASLGVSAVVGIYGILQMAGKLAIHQGSVRLDATLGNASYLAVYMIFNIFLALFYFAKEKEWYKWFYLPLIALQAIILYHTATRGAILGLIGGLALAGFVIALFSKSKKARVSAVSFIVLIIVLLGSFWALRSSDFIKRSQVLSRFSSISFHETTTQSRFVIWKMSWEGFKEKPILGWGPENFNLVFNKYYQPILYKQEPWFDRAHNVFFDHLISGGVFGLFAYLGLFFSALYYLLFKRKQIGFSSYDSAILTGLFGAYFFNNLFVFDNLISFLMFFAVLGYIHTRAVNQVPQTELEPRENVGDYKKPVLTAIAVAATVFTIYAVNVPPLLASYNLIGAFKESATRNFESALKSFQKSISYGSFGSTEAREHLVNFAMNIVQQPKIKKDIKIKVFEYASSEMKKQITQSPGDIRYMVFLGALYNKGGEYDKAINILEKAIELSPKKQQLYFELGTSYLNKGDYKKAVKILRTAFELEKSFDGARKIYALSLIYDGENNLAENVLKEKFGVDVIPDQRFINAYVRTGDFKMVARIWEKFIEKSPSNAQYRVRLAATYIKIGKREEAIKQLQKAIELKPDFKKQGEYYINEIRAGRKP